METLMTSSTVRDKLVHALRLDIIGPGHEDEYADERLVEPPSRWYLTGFLVPLGAALSERIEETDDDELDVAAGTGDNGDNPTPDRAAAKRAPLPSSIGLSCLLPATADHLDVRVSWGDYVREEVPVRAEPAAEGADVLGADEQAEASGRSTGGAAGTRTYVNWRRTPRTTRVALALPEQTRRPVVHMVPDSQGLEISVSVRKISGAAGAGVPAGTRSVSVFLVNRRTPSTGKVKDETYAFQAEIELHAAGAAGFLPRRDMHGLNSDDWDDRVADVQYRDVAEYSVGHAVAVEAEVAPDGNCRVVRTCWIPRAGVLRVEPAPVEGVCLSMDGPGSLAELADGAAARVALIGLVEQYRAWINAQRAELPREQPRRHEIAVELLNRAAGAAGRIEAGIDALADPTVLEAFRLANRAMADAARRRFGVMQGRRPEDVVPEWRPFQLAFILMNLPGLADPRRHDRDVVDLLFFPTGGGKTEAYLGLAAFAMIHRRLRQPGIGASGVAVLMRYTLRLLTLDQLSRASTLVCALELLRQADPGRLGTWPFEIGLWVGQAATPNRMGRKGDGDQYSARAKLKAFREGRSRAAPIPLQDCPWCGRTFTANAFHLLPSEDQPTQLRIACLNRDCAFAGDNPLPIQAVDESIYRRLPAFLIATVDKFAALPWTGEVGALFGRVDRYDAAGFYGPCDSTRQGRRLPGPLPPPELVIQDELHLISGPLGTIAGLYETAIDALCSRQVDGQTARPKVIASTATVRRAESQVRALFNRRTVDLFPPPGPSRDDAFFARTVPASDSPPRLYIGVAAQGRSLKVVLLRSYLALLAAALRQYTLAGGDPEPGERNPADPYMSLVGYFNSLRELGGSRRIVEDEVFSRLRHYRWRRRVGEEEGLFASRNLQYEVLELTSRRDTGEVAEAKRRLALPFDDEAHVDVALATNMISVGLDITRLGLMIVLGQPKSSAEYIQATSRVGRAPERPGLVVTLLNLHKHRDRSHYERFSAFHASFYRSVEATSVTPFAPRALDRGLVGALVGLVRQGHAPMTPPRGALEILQQRSNLDFAVNALSERAAEVGPLAGAEPGEIGAALRHRCERLLDDWARIAREQREGNAGLQYQREASGPRLLYDFADLEAAELPALRRQFRANRSMRDVEHSVNLWKKPLDADDENTDDDDGDGDNATADSHGVIT